MYNYLVFLHPIKKEFERHLITVETVIKCLFTIYVPTTGRDGASLCLLACC